MHAKTTKTSLKLKSDQPGCARCQNYYPMACGHNRIGWPFAGRRCGSFNQREKDNG